MERWIQMHYQIKEREQAMALARDREFFYWLSGFYITSLFGSISFYQRTRRPATLLPMIPLSFVMGYYADLAYGSKINRIKGKLNMHAYVWNHYKTIVQKYAQHTHSEAFGRVAVQAGNVCIVFIHSI